MSVKLACMLCTLLVAVPATLPAQSFESGTARDGARGTPYECLHVALLDSTGRAIDHTVTDSAGQFLFQVPRPGVYRVKFAVFSWEPLFGPVDTLKEGEFKERGYALDFKTSIEPDTDATEPRWRGDRRLWKLPAGYRRKQPADSGWTSRDDLPPLPHVYYPDGLGMSDTEGSLVGQFIVDSTGETRRGSWHTIASTNREFEKNVVKTIPKWRWQPARIRGQPVCELTFDLYRFGRDARGGRTVWMETR
jgi:hypothetical protein